MNKSNYTTEERLENILNRAGKLIINAYQKTKAIPTDGEYDIAVEYCNWTYKYQLCATNKQNGAKYKIGQKWSEITDALLFVSELAELLEALQTE